MNKTVLELLNEAYGEPNPEADSSGYGFDSQFNEPVNAEDSNHIMEPDNIAAVYFTENDDDEENLLFDYEMDKSQEPKDINNYQYPIEEDMIDISTVGKEESGAEIPPGEMIGEQDGFSPPGGVPVASMSGIGSEVSKIVNSPRELSPSEMGIDTTMSVEDALKENLGFGLVELLILEAHEN